MYRIIVLGDGGWGTTLAILLSKRNFDVTLWSVSGKYAVYLDKKRINAKFLPGIKIPNNIKITSDLDSINYSDLIILAIPSVYLRTVLRKIKSIFLNDKIFLSVIKGIELKTLLRVSEVIEDCLGKVRLASLSGPTIAHEVAKGIPTTAVVASKERSLTSKWQDVLSTDRFRVYTSNDVIGVELGGSLKNVIAIACGISDGLGFGTNTKAAIISRGLAEMARLGKRMGASVETFSGISGLGDLVTTCISPYSRNRFVGLEIAKGKDTRSIIKNMNMVAEGVYTVKSAYRLSKKFNVSMPITNEIYSVLYNSKSPFKAVNDLMTRERKSEL